MRRTAAIATLCAALGLGAAPVARAVVGGKPAPPGAFPYVANIFIGNAFGCSGTLIAPQWVMTAGHCGSVTGGLTGVASPVPPPASAYDVRLGSVYADGRGAERHTVTDIVVDSDYIVTNGAGNDVSLLHLDRASAIAPMRIAATGERSIWRAGVLATIAGFGLTDQNAQSPPYQMQFAQVPIRTDAECQAAYPHGLGTGDNSAYDPNTMLCAGYPQGGTDTCQGDSGGPLLAALPSGELRLVGATSYGDGCAQPGRYGVYARVAEGPIRSFIARFVPGAFAPEPGGGGRSSSGGSAGSGNGAGTHTRTVRFFAAYAGRRSRALRVGVAVPRQAVAQRAVVREQRRRIVVTLTFSLPNRRAAAHPRCVVVALRGRAGGRRIVDGATGRAPAGRGPRGFVLRRARGCVRPRSVRHA